MTYQELLLPSTLPPDVRGLIRRQLESQLADVHAMFRLPIKGDPGLQGGCNLATTQILLSIVSGVSVTLYQPAALNRRGVSAVLFKNLLIDHYPWEQEQHIAGARLGGDAAEDLYNLFRNPLAHALGVIGPKANPTARRVVIEKGSFREEDIEATESATSRPFDWENPTLREEGPDLILWAMSFYWGVRTMIQKVAGARAQSNEQSSYIYPSGLSGQST